MNLVKWIVGVIGEKTDLANIEINDPIRSVLGRRIGALTYPLVQKLKDQIATVAINLAIFLALWASTDNAQSSLNTFAESNNDSEESQKKGLGYARVSSQGQVDNDEDSIDEGSITDQVEAIRSVANEKDIGLVHPPVKDKAQTGTNFDREGIQKVFRMAQRDNVEYLLTQTVDRIGRSAAETLYFIHILQSECDVTLITTGGTRDVDEVSGLMHTTLLSLMAEVQNEIRTDKAKKSRVRKFLQKKQWSAYSPTVPIGYQKKDNGWLEVDSDESDAVKELFEKFLDCETYSETERQINKKYDGILEGHKIKTALQNPVYIGEPELPEEWVIDLPYDRQLNEPQLQIIDEKTFNKAQEIIERKNRKHSSDNETQDVTDFVEEFDLFSVIQSSDQVRLLHDCGEPMVKDGQEDLKGNIKVHCYYCPECEEYRKWPTGDEYDRMDLIHKIIQSGSNLLERLTE